MGESNATLNATITFILVLVAVWSLWYFFIFQNFMEVALSVWDWNFYPVEEQFWWLAVGLIFLSAIGASLKVFEYSRRGRNLNG